MKKVFSILTVAIAALVIVSCGGGSGPEAVAEQYLKHIANGEYEKAEALGTEGTKQFIGFIKNFPKSEKKNEVKDVKCTVEPGDTTAVCTYCCDDKGESAKINLAKQGGKWLVDQKKEMPDMGSMPSDTLSSEVPAETQPAEEPAK